MDGHLGLVPRELVEARTDESFRARAWERIREMTLAVVDGAIAGFVLVVDDEVEQVYVSGRTGMPRPRSRSSPATHEPARSTSGRGGGTRERSCTRRPPRAGQSACRAVGM
jgi:hypothetical protein